MPQIPGVPDLQPVDKPYLNPREAGKPGAVIADTGENAEGIADTGLDLEAHIREAQKHVDVIAAQNHMKALDDELQIELKKTTNSGQVKDVLDQYTGPNGKLNQVVKDFGKSPAAMEIQMSAQGLKPSMDTLGQARQLTLLGQENDANTAIQVKTLIPQIVAAHRSGDVAQEQQIHSHVEGLYDDAVKNGLMTAADKQLNMDAFREATQKQINEATIMSPNPAERKQAIAQLTKGGSGPLDLTNLAPGDINALREHAQEADKTLTGLSESQNLNGALNIMNSAFQAPEYKDNFDAQQHALEDGKWLTDHGIVDENGKPDFVMSDKLQQQVSVQRSYREKEEADKAADFASKLSPLIDNHKISLPQLEQAVQESGLTGKAFNSARAQLVRQWHGVADQAHQFATWDRQAAEQEKRSRSQDAAAKYMMNIMAGGMPDPVAVRTDPSMVETDKAQVMAALTESQKKDPNFLSAMTVINDAFPRPARPGTSTSPATPDQLNQYSAQDQQQLRKQSAVYTAWMQRINANPSENKMDALKDVSKSGIQKDIGDTLNRIFTNSPEAPTPWYEPWKSNWWSNQSLPPSAGAPPESGATGAGQNESGASAPPVGTVESPTSRKEYFNGMKKANPDASDEEINRYLDGKGIK